jgi:predicted amidohydrolase YtcJ
MAGRITAYLVALIVGTTFIAGLIVGAQRDDAGPVDLIVVNAKVYTADAEGTMAEAVAVQGNKILKVGTTREVQRLRRAQTVVVDAKGGAVLPGFNDAHTHLLSGGLALGEIDLADARTLPDVEMSIRAWTARNPDRPWVTGRGWYYDSFAGGLPTRQVLDALVPDRPAFLTSYDGHSGWANSRALKLAGITRRTPNPDRGVIVKDPRSGEPTGVLKESAMGLVSSLLPRPSRDERLAALRAAIAQASRRGVTSVQNAGVPPDELALYDELRRTRALDVRVYAALSAATDISSEELDAYDQLRAKYPDDPLFKTGAIKLFADGVIESHTAAMLEPYADQPGTRGEPQMGEESLNRLVADLDKRGWQILIHTIGDRAIRKGLDALAGAAAANPEPRHGRRHRLEHIETIDRADVGRFAANGVIASMQPYHSLPDPAVMGVWTASIGEERAARGWLYGTIARAGGLLAFGSDWPVAAMDPLLAIHVAVNRTTPDGVPAGGWLPGERLTLRQAIDGYTRNAAWASFDEHRKGSLERDMVADLVVLTRDIFALPAARLAEAEVAVTVFDGRIVYQRSAETDN